MKLNSASCHFLISSTLWALLYLVLEYGYGLENAFLDSLASTLLIVVPIYISFYIYDNIYSAESPWTYFIVVSGSLVILSLLEYATLRNSFLINTDFKNFLANNILYVLSGTLFRFSVQGWMNQFLWNRIEYEKLEMEAGIIKLLMAPKLLRNSLENLEIKITQGSKDDALKMILDLSTLLRYVTKSINRKKISMDEEVIFVNCYLKYIKNMQNKDCNVNLRAEHDCSRFNIVPGTLYIIVDFFFDKLKRGGYGFCLIEILPRKRRGMVSMNCFYRGEVDFDSDTDWAEISSKMGDFYPKGFDLKKTPVPNSVEITFRP